MAELVLIVDDNERNVKLVRDVLEAAGMTTLSASTAADGLALAREHTPDLVLMDLRLPDGGGADAARSLRDDEITARIPVVAMSALRQADAGGSIDAAGFAGYIEKPVDVRDLPAQIRRYVAGG